VAEITQSRVLPPEFIEAAGKTYLSDLSKAVGKSKTADLSKVYGAQFVAGQDPLQAQAINVATKGIGGYQPYLQAAAAATGPTGYQQFMSPYQQDIIDATLGEYDLQAQKGLGSISQQAIQSGAFGGAREGVAEAEYRSTSDRNRASLQAQLLQQGFGQANQLAAQQYQQQLGLGSAQQGFLGQDVGALSTLGASLQAQRQAELGAQQQLAQQQLNQPIQAAQQYGSGVTSLIAGYPGQTQTQMTPSPSPLSTALGVGSTLAGIYRAVTPQQLNITGNKT
tara:strand:+ start:63 stop:902 length:840 start_codon:yes stop_codon:yes gene_type:complete